MTRRAFAGIVILVLGCGVAVHGQATGNVRPTASFRAVAASGTTETTVVFDASGSKDSDGRIVAYQWVFGDGTTGSGAKLEHDYPRVGLYDVTLVVTDDESASHMITERIDVARLPDGEPAGLGTVAAPPELPSAPSTPPATGPRGNGVGDRAPSFALPDFDGRIVTLADYLGKVVLVEFFFSTCSGCVASLPRLATLSEGLTDEGLIVMVVVLDRDPGDARNLFADPIYDDLIVLREADPTRPTRSAYNVSGVPHVVLIDRAGVIRYTGRPGYLTDDQIKGWL